MIKDVILDAFASGMYAQAPESLKTEVADLRTGEDGTVYESAGGAVRAQIAAITGRIARGDASSTNLFQTEQLQDGYYVSYSSGRLIENPAMTYTDFIDIASSKQLYATNAYYQAAFFDVNQNYISGVTKNNETMQKAVDKAGAYDVITVPPGAVYCRWSTRKSMKNSYILSTVQYVNYAKGYEIVPHRIAENNIVRNMSKCVYDIDFSKLDSFSHSEYTDNGALENGAYVLTRKSIQPYKYSTMDKSKISAIFAAETGSVIHFGYFSNTTPIGDTTTDSQLVCVIDTDAKTLNVRKWNWDGDLGASIGSASFTFDLSSGNYCISVEKDTVYHVIVKLFNADCPDEIVTVEKNVNIPESQEIVNTYMRCWGCGRFEAAVGTARLGRFSMYATGNTHPKVYAVGDSYIEHAGRNPLCGYAQRLYAATNGDVLLSGRGGATLDNVRKRLLTELCVVYPQYCILQVGMNDSVASGTTAATFREKLLGLIEMVERENIIPVLCTIPRRLDHDNLAFINAVNPWIRGLGYRVIDEAAALSTGDGITQDAAKYQSDKIHPTIRGGDAIFRWIEANLPELLA